MSVSAYITTACGAAIFGIFYLYWRSRNKSQTQPLPRELHATLKHARSLNQLESSNQTLTLADKRLLSYATYGNNTGPTILFFHGFGDCRLTGALFDKPAKELGLRIVAVDRPGNGRSSSGTLGRRALDFADDIQQLVAHLDLNSYGIIGVSGGGPYALACAYALPHEQLQSVAMLAATGPWSLTSKHSSWAAWLSLGQVGKLHPRLLRWLARKNMTKYLNISSDEYVSSMQTWSQSFVGRLLLHKNDIPLVQDEEFLKFVLQGLKENCSRPVEDMLEEWRVLTMKHLGFELGDIRKDLPMEMWYGMQDKNVSQRIGYAIQKAIGGRATMHLREETHLGMLANCREMVLRSVKEAMDDGY